MIDWPKLMDEYKDDIIREMKNADRIAYEHPGFICEVYLTPYGDVGVEEFFVLDKKRYVRYYKGEKFTIAGFCHKGFDPIWGEYSPSAVVFALDIDEQEVVAYADAEGYDLDSYAFDDIDEEIIKWVLIKDYPERLMHMESVIIDNLIEDTDYEEVYEDAGNRLRARSC